MKSLLTLLSNVTLDEMALRTYYDMYVAHGVFCRWDYLPNEYSLEHISLTEENEFGNSVQSMIATYTETM